MFVVELLVTTINFCFSLLGSKAMFYLAAAVSDFYIPAYEMPEHKIQSSNGPLQVLYNKYKY